MKKKIILTLLVLGIIYRLFLTSNGNFLFNMDNARDFVDVREMVELKKFRLTGPTSAIEGLYNGPLWYYLLAIPYIITSGNPYGAIIMEIILWAVGGFFLLKLVGEFNKWLVIPIGFVWIASDYVVLANLYSFNPNPLVFLTPLFIFSLTKYIKTKKGFWIILTYFLAGAFFNFEMNFGIWTAPIILVSLFLINKKLFKDKYFWLGVFTFMIFLMPQFLFDLKHNFLMSRAVLKFLSETKESTFNPLSRIKTIYDAFINVFQATLMNQKLLSSVLLILIIPVFKVFLSGTKNITGLVTFMFIITAFIGYLFIPVTVNAWHLGGPAAAFLIIIAFILATIWKINFFGKLLTIVLSFFLILFSFFNVVHFFINDYQKPKGDPSLFKNEIAAIDYVYKKADGGNFKVYTYLPSVYDYPYQYLFWWYGKKYGFVPAEYKYLPNKPPYIPSQAKFEGSKSNLSNLVFLIKEPDRNYTRAGWEGSFINLKSVDKTMVGPIEVETRKQ